jgi:hypothetical protein
MISSPILFNIVFKAGSWPVINKDKMEDKVYSKTIYEYPCGQSYDLDTLGQEKGLFLQP